MRLFRNIFLFLTLAAIVFCGGSSYDRKLVEIDSLTMNGESKRAMSLLDSVGTDGLSKSDRMYYELLCIKARDKAFINHQSDSAVAEIVEYFESHDKDKQPEAYYYAGSVYRDLHDAPQAVAYFQKCIDALPDDSNLTMKSNACFQCGTLFRAQNLQGQAVEMFEESFRCDSLMNDTIRMITCLSSIASARGINLDRDSFDNEVFSTLRKALTMANAIDDENSIATVSSAIAFIYCYLEDYDKVSEYLPTIENYLKTNDNKYERDNFAFYMARKFMAAKQYDAALPYCEHLRDCDYADYSRYAAQYLYHIYVSKAEYAKAQTYLNRYEFLTDSLNVENAQDATAQANALYNYQLRERDNLTLKAESQSRLYTIFIFCAVFIAGLFAFSFYQLRQKQKQQILNQQISRLRQFEKMQQEQSEATATQQDLTRQRLFESEAYKFVRQLITENKPLRDSDLAKIDETINQICDGFKSTLYSAYNLSAQEYSVCLLLKFELSATEISNLLSRTTAAISQTRKRLYAKLFGKNGSAGDLDAYIRSI